MNPSDQIMRGNVNAKVLDIIKTVLIQIFEDESMEATFRVLKERYGLEVEDIPKRPQVFSQALLSLFGKGAAIIEDLILEKLYSDFKVDLQWKESYKFSDYIEDLTQSPTIA